MFRQAFPTPLISALIAATFVVMPRSTQAKPKTSSCSEATPSGGTWRTLAPTPTPPGHAAVVVSGKVYGIGTTVDEYDSVNDTWTTRTSVPTTYGVDTAVALDGKIYMIESRSYGAVLVYDPAANTWATLDTPFCAPPFPCVNIGASLGAADGSIYVVGGNNESQVQKIVMELDLAGPSWIPRAPMPTARQNPSLATARGLLYAIGGCNGTGVAEPWAHYKANESYDPTSDAWSILSPMPFERCGAGIAVSAGTIYVIGGDGENAPATDTVQVYDPGSDTWSCAARLPHPRSGLAAVAVGGRILTLGGYDGTAWTTIVEEFTPNGHR